MQTGRGQQENIHFNALLLKDLRKLATYLAGKYYNLLQLSCIEKGVVMLKRSLIGLIFLIFVISGCSSGKVGTDKYGDESAVDKKESPSDTSQKGGEEETLSETTIGKLTGGELGDYLVDQKGMTLYLFAKDANGKNNCAGPCADNWPIFHTDEVTVPDGVDAKDFGEIETTDGKKQTTYKGWPLYYFAKDEAAGDTNGEGVNGIWFIAKPDYDVFLGTKDDKVYLTDAAGNTLYRFTKDEPSKSNCTGACIENWPVFMAEDVVAPSAIDKAKFASITGAGGKEQSTFGEVPLYYFAKDEARGDTNGDGVNEVWFLVEPTK